MALPEDSLANPSQSLDSERENKTKDTYGLKPYNAFALYDHDMRIWKTCQASLLPDISDEFTETWPKQGIMLDGVCWVQTIVEPRTDGKGGGVWPTPRAQDGPHGPARDSLGDKVRWPSPRNRMTGAVTPNQSTDKFNNLESVMARRTWPTPSNSMMTVGDMEQARYSGNDPDRPSYKEANRIWPTPQQRDYRSLDLPGSGNRERKEQKGWTIDLPSQVGGQLNPDWVELLMGWPKNWTCLNPISMIEFDKWLMGFQNEKEKNGAQKMPTLRQGNEQEEVRQAIRGLQDMDEEKILQPILCESPQSINEKRVLLESKEASERKLRGLPKQDTPSCSPQGWGHDEQRTGEHSDALHPLPQVSPRYGREAWLDGSWELGVARVATGIKERVNKLKAIGNGQVPLVAATAWRVLNGKS